MRLWQTESFKRNAKLLLRKEKENKKRKVVKEIEVKNKAGLYDRSEDEIPVVDCQVGETYKVFKRRNYEQEGFYKEL